MTLSHDITPQRMRTVLGHFATGLTVVTAHDSTGPVGFTCQSFTSLSLEPPLISINPTKGSSTWPKIRQLGSFAVIFCRRALSSWLWTSAVRESTASTALIGRSRRPGTHTSVVPWPGWTVNLRLNMRRAITASRLPGCIVWKRLRRVGIRFCSSKEDSFRSLLNSPPKRPRAFISCPGGSEETNPGGTNSARAPGRTC